MAETTKKAAPRKTAAKKAAVPSPPDEDTIELPPLPPAPQDASWLALQWLLPRAFPHGQWAHAASVIEDSGLPREVQDVLLEAYGRATA